MSTAQSKLSSIRRAVAALITALAVFGATPARSQPQTSGNSIDYTYIQPPFTSSVANCITVGPDGALWYTDLYNGIVRMTTAGDFTAYSVPTPGSNPQGITTGPDGALWFTEAWANQIGRITVSGEVTEYPLPVFGTLGNEPWNIVAGPDGAMWFAENNNANIGRITTSGEVTQFPTGTSSDYLTVGPDNAIWFAGYGGVIGRLTTEGALTSYTAPTPNSWPDGITVGSDGALWFTEFSAAKIGRITTQGAFTEYPLPSSDNASPAPQAIASGGDGALWFTTFIATTGARGFWRMTTAGLLTEYGVVGGYSITPGPEGDLWFTGPNDGVTLGKLPACGTGLRASFSDGTLTMSFALGTDFASNFTVEMAKGAGQSGTLASRNIGPVTPPATFTLTKTGVADLGVVRVTSRVTAADSVRCVEWMDINTSAP